MLNLSTTNRALGQRLALCNSQTADEVAHGRGLAIELARAAEGADQTAPDWVQLLPAGPTVNARSQDGRAWNMLDPAAVVAHFKAGGVDLPIDINHATEIQGPQGGEAPAQGWINDMAVRDDGTVWGKVAWLASGAAAVATKAYRYISPAIIADDARNILGLQSAGLVTTPALTMPALARRNSNPDKDTPLTTIVLATAAAALGLAATATEADVFSGITAGVQARKDLLDPTKFVPAADLAAAQTRATTAEGKLTKIETDGAAAKAEGLIDGAIAGGKIPPASKAHWLEIASSNYDGAEKALGAMPKVLEVTVTEKKPGGDDKTAHGLDASQLSLCSTLGVKPEDYAATLAAKEQA